MISVIYVARRFEPYIVCKNLEKYSWAPPCTRSEKTVETTVRHRLVFCLGFAFQNAAFCWSALWTVRTRVRYLACVFCGFNICIFAWPWVPVFDSFAMHFWIPFYFTWTRLEPWTLVFDPGALLVSDLFLLAPLSTLLAWVRIWLGAYADFSLNFHFPSIIAMHFTLFSSTFKNHKK